MPRRTIRRLFLVPLLLLVGLGVAACGESLPEEMPPGIEIRYDDGGGMLPDYEQLDLRVGQGVYEWRRRDDRGRIEFDFSEAQMREVYDALRAANFAGIEAEDRGRVYDRGGRTIVVTWRGGRVRVSNSGNMFVTEGSREDWGAALSAVGRVIARVQREHGQQN